MAIRNHVEGIPTRVDPLPPPSGPLVLRRAAGERTFLAAGERAWISGREESGADEVRIGPHRPLRDLRGASAPAARLEASPGIVRRELLPGDSGAAPGVETLLAFHTFPAAVLQWAPVPTADEGLDLSLSWTCELPARLSAPAERRWTGPVLALDDAEGEPGIVYLAASRRARWRLTPRPGGERCSVGIGLEVEGEPGAPITLLVGVPPGGEESAALLARRLARLEPELVRWSEAGGGVADPFLRLASPEREVDRGVAWAASRVAAWRCAEPSRRADRGHLVRGLLATGRFDGARELLDRWLDAEARGEMGADAGADGESGESAAGCLEAAGEYALWSGDRGWLGRSRTALDALATALAGALGGRADGPGAAVRGLRALAAGAELPGGDPWSRAIRQRAEALGDAGSGPTPAASPTPASEPAFGAGDGPWEEEPDRAFARWRERLLRGMGKRGGRWGSPAAAGLLPAELVFGMLGARADAAFGRLRIAPSVPRPWSRFDVEGIRIGDGAVRVGYRRSEARHTFVLEQTRGRVPVDLVFEPALPMAAPGVVRVNGEPAEVERRRLGARLGFRLQLPLDSPREVSVDREARERP